ncbi:MAG: hypothetical protein ACRBDI_05655 [Alphaproteobacteria bacterium]
MYDLISEVLEKSIDEKLVFDDIECLSLYSKCRLIREMVGALGEKLPQKKYGTGRHTRQSLLMIANTFNASENLLSYQKCKRGQFSHTIAQPEYSRLLDVVRSWESSEDDEKQGALIEFSSLHRSIYMTGIADNLPISYEFKDGAAATNHLKKTKLYGSFLGDLLGRSGKLSHYIREDDPADLALSVVHHETTHALQFYLASAYHYKQIRPDHILYEDARMFHALEINKGFVNPRVLKASEYDSYESQVHEVLARSEGDELSRIVVGLSFD